MNPDLLPGIVGFVVFIFSVVVHENAHAVVAEHFGDPTARRLGRITLNPIPHIDPIGSIVLPLVAYAAHAPMLGWAKPVPVHAANLRNPLVHNACVAAAGPASNFILAFAGALVWIVVGLAAKHALLDPGGHTVLFFDTLCRNLIILNCVLAVFNLLPIPPLDGHWILLPFLPGNARAAFASVGRYGFIVLIVLLWSGALWWIIGPPFRLVVTGYQQFVGIVIRAL